MWNRLRGWWRSARHTEDLEAELASHVALETHEQIERGVPAEEAAAQARKLFGNRTLIAEQTRGVWSVHWLENLWRDLRIARRSLARSPGFTIACITTLALTLGANSAMFSVVYAEILKPLPYPAADRLVALWQKVPILPFPAGDRMQSPRAVYQEWRQMPQVFDRVEAYQILPLNEAGVSSPHTVQAAHASAGLLPLLGAAVPLGRLFTPAQESPGADRVAVLSDSYFSKRYHRDKSVIGQTLALGNQTFTIIGVLSKDFRIPQIYGGMEQPKADVWLPLSLLWKAPKDDLDFRLYTFARLRPGVTVASARRAISALQTRLNKQDSERFPITQANLFPLIEESQSSQMNLALFILLGTVAFLLLIGCANLANLNLARSAEREREVSVRLALGASSGRVVAQFLVESLVIAFTGAALGLLLARGIIALVIARGDLSHPEDITLNWPVFAFTGLAAIATALLFGLAPALTASRVRVSEALKRRGGHASASLGKTGRWLTAAQVALAVVLLCGVGLMIRSFTYIIRTGLGFNTEHLVVADIGLPEARYPDAAARARFYDRLAQQAAALRGVRAAAVTNSLPLKSIQVSSFAIAGRPKPKTVDESPSADMAKVSPDYFRLIGMRLLAGRTLTTADTAAAQKPQGDGVAVVNQAFVDKYFPGRNPLGQHLLMDNDHPFAIVGVVQNYLVMGAIMPARPQIWRPGPDAPGNLLVLRTVGSVPVADSIRSLYRSLDPNLPLPDPHLFDDLINEVKKSIEFGISLMAGFTALALLLAMLGVSAVMAHLVAARTREFGIRMALGATPANIASLVSRHTLWPVLFGLGAGLAAALGLSRLVQSFLYGVTPTDAATYLSAIAAVALATPIAIAGPLRRATAVECTVALREE